MNKLTEARNVLKNLYSIEISYNPASSLIITSFPGWTMLVYSYPGMFGGDSPMVNIVRDSDLLKLYGYAERYFNGDYIFDTFDGFDGELFYVSGKNDICIAFYDFWMALVSRDGSGVCRVTDFEAYMKK